MQEISEQLKSTRINSRALVVLLVLVVVGTVGLFVLDRAQRLKFQANALETAKNMAVEGHVDLAIRHLDSVLSAIPSDAPDGPARSIRIEALEFKAQLLEKYAYSLNQLLDAALAYDLFIRTDPIAPNAQDARRRMAKLYLMYSDIYKEGSYYRVMPEATAFHARYRAAANAALELIQKGADDSTSHRLLAQAFEGISGTGDEKTLNDAIREYERALQLDPKDVKAAERLANLLNSRTSDPVGARLVLDDLVKASPSSIEARLARHRFFLQLGRDKDASAELQAALKIVPDDPAACLATAEMALRLGRTSEARAYVAKIPEKERRSLRVRVILGLIELNENRPEEAMEVWRKGLLASHGTDAMLTWNLAFSFLQLGRVEEARPLVAQFRRLSDDDASPVMGLLLALEDQKTGHPLRAANRLEGLRDRIDVRWLLLLYQTLGECYREAGDDDRSIVAFRKLLRENPQSISVRVTLAELLMKKRPDGAVTLVEEGLSLTPEDPTLRVNLVLANLRLQEKLPSPGRSWVAFDKAMEKALAVAPNHPLITQARSLRQSLDGNTGKASAMLEEAVRREPRKAPLWQTWAEVLIAAGQPLDALHVLEQASSPQAAGDQIGLRILRARVLSGLGHVREARELLLGNLEKLTPDQRPVVWEALGRDLVGLGNIAEARGIYTEWARQVPDDSRPRLALLEMALYAEGPDAQAASRAIRQGGLDDVAERLDRARELIRSMAGQTSSKTNRDDPRLVEAERLLGLVRSATAQAPALDALQGEFLEVRGSYSESAAAYQLAWSRGLEGVLPRLVALLASRRPSDLEQLSRLSRSPRLDRLAVQAYLKLGQPDRAVFLALNDATATDQQESSAWRVEVLERLGKLEEAEIVLRADTKRHPDSIEPWLALLRSQVQRGRTLAVSLTINEAKRAVKDTRTDFVTARLCWAGADRPGATKAFLACLTKLPDDPEVLLSIATYDQDRGRPAEAETHLRHLLTLDPGHRLAARRLALLLASQPLDEAGWERAWSTLGTESSGSESTEDRITRGFLLAKGPGSDRRRRAVEVFEGLVADLPADTVQASTARSFLARLLLEAGQADRAVKLLEPSAIKTDDVEEVALHIEALLQAGQVDLAGPQLDRLAWLAPRDDREPKFRARWTAAQARYGEVAPALERAFHALGDSPRARPFGREAFAILINRTPPADESAEQIGQRLASWTPGASWMPAMIAARHDRTAEALKLCRAAVEAGDPADGREAVRVAFDLAVAKGATDRLAELESLMKTAYQKDPNGTEIPLLLAQLRHRQGHYEEVIRIYRDIIDRRPELRASIQNNMAWILSENLHRPAEAILQVDDLIQGQGRTAPILDTRGVVLTRLGRLDEAIKNLEESIQIHPESLHLFHLARAYRDAGRLEDFRRCRDLVLRAGLTADAVDSTERADLAAILKP